MTESFKKVNATGKLHCVDGPAIRTEAGVVAYYINGVLHREDGPALVYSDKQEWWFNGKRHREDGPAVAAKNIQMFWHNDVLYDAPMKKYLKENYPDYEDTEEYQVIIKMIYPIIIDS